jgi:restriction system protein
MSRVTMRSLFRRGLRTALKCLSRLVNAWRLRGLPEHRWRVRRSRRLLARLRSAELRCEPARCFAYLRKIEPLVFEELVLTAFEDAGCLVLRSTTYSGDGGVDGLCFVPGGGWRPWALQIKRYAGHVAAKHVCALGLLVEQRGLAGGLFVHCGRTGSLSWTTSHRASLHVVSGQQLLRLLIHRAAPAMRCGGSG